MVLMQLTLCVSLCEAQVQDAVKGECHESHLAFRADIRSPDAWEMIWESRWPDASIALNAWRNDQFELLVQMWRKAAPALVELKREVAQSGMPESAAYLVWWSTLNNPFDAASRVRPDEVDLQLSGMHAEEAMAWGHAQSATDLTLEAWAKAVRTGMRLIENFDLPEVHVVQEGETVYSIARAWDISPRCLAAKNNVWDDIQPGMTLLIPHPSD